MRVDAAGHVAMTHLDPPTGLWAERLQADPELASPLPGTCPEETVQALVYAQATHHGLRRSK